MNKERALIHDFYTAFKNRDADKMAACYHPNIEFTDPVFGTLRNSEPAMMWRMLLDSSKGKKLDVVYRLMSCNDDCATVEWEAKYEFSKHRRPVHNLITATFRFEDGKIVQHLDYFDFHKWASMALGFPGIIFGWMPFFQNKVRAKVGSKLKTYIHKHAEVIS